MMVNGGIKIMKTKFDEFKEPVNEGFNRNLLPKMVSLSRNCRLTQELANTIEKKFNSFEIDSFIEWL